MGKSIAVFGAGPGLGQAVARRYRSEGYDVVVVGRRREPLAQLAGGDGTVRVITADLSDPACVPAASLTAARAQDFMPLVFYTMVDLVREFLPDMLARGDGAILTAQGASTLQGLPGMSGSGPAQAAQRNYLQSLHAEVAGQGIYVGMLYIGAIIERSAFHAWITTPGNATRDWGPTVSPDHLAGLLWNMHAGKGPTEARYPG
jgi:short-subunit dehydrogenase